MKISPEETEIVGQWKMGDGRAVADENCRRIADLTRAYLVEIANDASGWDTLYRDPTDGRFWELIYPQSHLQGGGPPALRHLSERAARSKYGDMANK